MKVCTDLIEETKNEVFYTVLWACIGHQLVTKFKNYKHSI